MEFTLLGSGEAVDEERLRELYSYPDAHAAAHADPTRPLLRGNVIASLDGAATTAGLSGGLGGAGDRKLFALLRELADVIVVGAGTARAENYGGARMTAAQRERRRLRGQPEVPPIAVVTRSGVLGPDLPVLADREAPPLVLTCAAAATDTATRVGSAVEVIDCSGADPEQVDLRVALTRLAERGLARALTEGGPSLLGAFAERGLLDELCVTAAPMLVGGDAVRILAGGAETPTPMRCRHVLTDPEGYLYLRYTSG